MTDRPAILVVEDDVVLSEMLIDHLGLSLDATVTQAASAAAAHQHIRNHSFDLILMDIGLPDGDGLDVIRGLREHSDCPVLVMTGRPTLQHSVAALRLGAHDLLIKPFDLHDLTSAARQAVNRYQACRKAERRTVRLEGLVRKVLQDRRSLQERVDLVCRDLVGAYRDLAERFTNDPPDDR